MHPIKSGWISLAALVIFGTTPGAGASVLFSDHATLPPPREQVQFNDDSLLRSGNLIEGITNQTHAIIHFTGDESLFTTGAGQAGIAADDGGFAAIAFEPADGLLAFTGAGFNLLAIEDGAVTLTAHTTTGDESATFDLRRNGQNRFHFTLDDPDQLIERVSLSSTVDLSDLRQVRLQMAPIPEPATLGLVAIGSLLLLRRRH